ncbi:hypothetical protein QOZ80_1AG0009950 [Eleusine coracana subsp. coracana]|nr:hypothetical protein QOZ80_1AG0009950 [Eleusine coracana subsp. coracana]
MATHTHSVSLVVLFVLSSALAAARANDEAALHAFKLAAISGRNGDPLASWNSSLSGYCSWEGVRCRSRGRHQRVVALSLPSYELTGVLSPAIGNLTSLRTLNLSKNGFSGDIPASLGRLHHLHILDLSRNSFSGEVPTNLTSCINLTILNLNFNQLHGCVSSEIGDKLAGLRFLGLAKNNLTGTIPASLGNLSSLIILQLGFNQLEGIIPPIFGVMRGIQFLDLAFNNLSGKGSFGTVYKCTFQDEGTIVAVKVFNLEHSGSTRSFVAECEALRRARHRCLLKIITCCSSINHQGQEFKALVFEFMPNGSLNDWLHPKSGTPAVGNTLSFAQRVNIVVDIMDALDYLHNHCQPPIVHCDVKPSNILLDEDMSARVGDFGISRILPESAHNTLINSNSTTGIRGSIGYVAPEYGEGSSISTIGDVYSLGILLLEMFTGLSPTNDMFRGALDLHKFSADALSNRIWEIADTAMWLHADTRDSTTRSRIEKCLVSVISLGISCSDKQPKERKPIQDAAAEMHAIRDSYIKFARSPVVDHGDIETAMSCVTG